MAAATPRGLFLLLLALSFFGCAGQPPPPGATPEDRIVVLVSLDGWRRDYAERAATPTLNALAARGVSADALIPVFPPKTFPSHYTIVTGLYPGHHGIVSNVMEEPGIGVRFTLSSPAVLDPRWWSGEPIWTTAERQGKRAATMFWPGSDVEIEGRRPSYWHLYDGSFSEERRVARVLEWLALGEEQRPSLITVYFSSVDSAGHEYGPGSTQVVRAAERLDALLGELIDGVRTLGLLERRVIVVTSDHGMSQVSPERVVFIDDYLDLSTVDVIEWSPVLGLAPKSGSADDVYEALRGRHPALDVYRREDVPAELQYSKHPRIPPVLGIADDGWTITSRARFERQREAGDLNGGMHGYLPSFPSMQGIFVAAGPGLQVGRRVQAFENVHLYELLCALLGLVPAPNDGDASVTRPLLAHGPPFKGE